MAFRPLAALARFLFYKVIVRLYRLYLLAAKRLGLAAGPAGGLVGVLNSQRTIHLVIGVMTVGFVFFNLTAKTQAVSPEEAGGRTFLSEIISGEFGGTDALIEEYFDEEAAITPVQQTYLDNLTAFRPQPSAEMAAPEDAAALGQGALSQGGDALRKPELAATTKGQRPREETVYYAVQTGDSISTIAAAFNVSVNTILWENDLNAYSLIRPGDKLAILPSSGISYKVARNDNLAGIAARYGVEANSILEANKLASAEMLAVGRKIFIPGGKKTYYAAAPAARAASPVDLLKDLLKPSDLKVVANKLAWPTVGARITQYFSWRHYAVDIANKLGTPIYATDAGTVEVAGWGTGYGNQIVIDHGGGRKSRYGHLSKFYVKKGQVVKKGEVIGLMGSTGRSTGPHVHFEYIINGIKYNPLNYLK